MRKKGHSSSEPKLWRLRRDNWYGNNHDIRESWNPSCWCIVVRHSDFALVSAGTKGNEGMDTTTHYVGWLEISTNPAFHSDDDIWEITGRMFFVYSHIRSGINQFLRSFSWRRSTSIARWQLQYCNHLLNWFTFAKNVEQTQHHPNSPKGAVKGLEPLCFFHNFSDAMASCI